MELSYKRVEIGLNMASLQPGFGNFRQTYSETQRTIVFCEFRFDHVSRLRLRQNFEVTMIPPSYFHRN